MYLNIASGAGSALGLGDLPRGAVLDRSGARPVLRIRVPLLIRRFPHGMGQVPAGAVQGSGGYYLNGQWVATPGTALTPAIQQATDTALSAQQAYDANYFATVPYAQWPELVKGGGSPYLIYQDSLQNPGGCINIFPGACPSAPATLPAPGGAPAGGGGGGASSASGTTPPSSVSGSATLQNTSRPGSPFQVGDSWKLVVVGAPKQPVTSKTTFNGKTLADATYGNTDSNGNQVLTGTMTADTVGSWSEQWLVGGVPVGTLNFTVTQPSGGGGAGGGSSSGGAGGGGGTTDGGTTSTANPLAFLSFLTNPVALFGYNIPWFVLLGAGAGALYLLNQGGGGHARK